MLAKGDPLPCACTVAEGMHSVGGRELPPIGRLFPQRIAILTKERAGKGKWGEVSLARVRMRAGDDHSSGGIGGA